MCVEAGGFDHELVDEAVVRRAGGPLGEQREHHEPGVVVREPLTGREHLWVAVERGHVRLGVGHEVHGDRHDVGGDALHGRLVEVVADARPMGEQVLDGDRVVDQRQRVAEDLASRGAEREHAALHERHHGERRERLGAARDADAGVGGHLDAMGAVGEPGRPLDDRRPADVDSDDARERRLGDHGVERVTEFGRVAHAVDRTTRRTGGVVEVPAQPTQWRRAGGVVERELDPRPAGSCARLAAASRARRSDAAGDEVHRRAVRGCRVRRRVRGARLRGRAPRS